MTRIPFLLVVNLVLLVDALTSLGITNTVELGLGRNVFLKIAARASSLAGRRLGAVDDFAIIMLAGRFRAAIFHGSSPWIIERATLGAVPTKSEHL